MFGVSQSPSSPLLPHNSSLSSLSSFHVSRMQFLLSLGLTLFIGLIISPYILPSSTSNPSAVDNTVFPSSNAIATLGKSGGESFCLDPAYSKKTLKTVKDSSMIALFQDTKSQKKFEASSIIKVDNYFYIVYDNLFSIGRVKDNIPIYSEENELIGEPGQDSGYEAICFDSKKNRFFVIIEAVAAEQQEGNFHAIILELELTTDKTTGKKEFIIHSECPAEFLFTSGNKGFEGVACVWVPPPANAPPTAQPSFHLIGLCEGNHCAGGAEGKEEGNGRGVVMSHVKLTTDETEVENSEEEAAEAARHVPSGLLLSHNARQKKCMWRTEKVIKLPTQAKFTDYSAMSLRAIEGASNTYKAAIASQENAAVWVGEFNTNDWQFGEGSVYHFPRNDNCQITYCNVEGVFWLNDQMIAAVSDKMKSGGKQPYHCLEKDQSVHIMVLP